MKPRNYLILAGVIVILVFILIINSNSNRTNFRLPHLKELKQGDITELVIERNSGKIILKPDNGNWYVNAEKYLADERKISNAISAAAELKISDLASESKNYALYQLDESNRVTVKAFKGDKLIRSFDAGSAVTTGKHTYIKLPDHKEVYIAQGMLREVYDNDFDSFRDKNVMKFNRDSIKAVSITDKTGKSGNFYRQMVTNIIFQTNNTIQTNIKPVWKSENGRDVVEPELDQIIRDLSEFSCDKYIYDKKIEDLSKSGVTYKIKAYGEKEFVLSVYASQNDQYTAVSSENKQPFLIPKWKVENIELNKIYKTAQKQLKK